MNDSGGDEEQRFFQDQVLRKQWAEGILKEQGIPINPHLPMIESESETTLRSQEDIRKRLTALVIVAAKGTGVDQDTLLKLVKQFDAEEYFSPDEYSFVYNQKPGDHDFIQFSWRYEAAWVLLWVLSMGVETLGPPLELCSGKSVFDFVVNEADFEAAKMRSTNDVLNEADLIYRYHWAVRQAGIEDNEPPGGLNPGVTMEWHHALNWLICYGDQEWDDVTTAT